MTKPRILCYIVAYQAAPFITKVLDSIPQECWNNAQYEFTVLVSDDSSADNTSEVCDAYIRAHDLPILLHRTSHNLGYGGNQKFGYDYAIAHKFDAVILLHGDGQYDPAYIPSLIAPILFGKAQAVLGSRMLEKASALKGGMPFYKFIGNIVLTKLQNRLLRTQLAEFHTGYRAYSTAALACIAYNSNNDGYVFDTEILIQLLNEGFAIKEVSVSTFYGEEPCHVNGLNYAWHVFTASLSARLHRHGFIYDPRFDTGPVHYEDKTSFASSHQFALQHVPTNSKLVADLGGSKGFVARHVKASGRRVVGMDVQPPPPEVVKVAYDEWVQMDLNALNHVPPWSTEPDTVLLLDVIEHLIEPDAFLLYLKQRLQPTTRVIITVPNIAFLTVRLRLLLGDFTYGTRGTLDRTHLHFYTFKTLRQALRRAGYHIVLVKGIPAPFPLVFRSKRVSGALLKFNQILIFILPGLFSYQIGIVAKVSTSE